MAARWRISSDQPREELQGDGTFEPSRVITFELLDSGRTGVVIVPLRNYTVQMVSSQIQAYADQIEEIGSLGG